MTLYASDLSKRISSSMPSISDIEEITGVPSSDIKQLNRAFLQNVGNALSANKSQEVMLLNQMLDLTASAKDTLLNNNLSFSGIATAIEDHNITGQLYNAGEATLDEFKQAGSNLIDSAKQSCTDIKNNCMNFAKSINPLTSPTNFLALVDFLRCPELSLLGDITNAFSMLTNNASNINPMGILSRSLVSLTQSLVPSKFIQGTTPLLSFLTDLHAYLNTRDSDRGYALSLIQSILGSHNKDIGYLTRNPIYGQMFSDLIEKDNLNGGSYGSNYSVYSNQNTQCSKLGKIINQLSNSYRSNNRFDDLTVRREATSSISDSNLLRRVDDILGISTRGDKSALEMSIHKSNGYHGNTAINASTSTVLENMRISSLLLNQLNEINNDDNKLEAVKINSSKYIGYIKNVNNSTSQRLHAFDEGVGNIKRRSSFFDLSKSFSGIV